MSSIVYKMCVYGAGLREKNLEFKYRTINHNLHTLRITVHNTQHINVYIQVYITYYYYVA